MSYTARANAKTPSRVRAKAWIIDAAIHGYSVRRDNGEDLTMSIQRARARAKWEQLSPTEKADDIPF